MLNNKSTTSISHSKKAKEDLIRNTKSPAFKLFLNKVLSFHQPMVCVDVRKNHGVGFANSKSIKM